MKYVKLFEEFISEATMSFYSDSMDTELKVGYKVELTNGQYAQIIRLPSIDEYQLGKMAFVMTGTGITAEVDPNTEIKRVIDTTELDKDMAKFIETN